MSTENHTEISVNGLVIYDLNDLPTVTVESDRYICGDTTIPRTGANISFDELRQRSQELYAIAMRIREEETSPELARMIAVIEEQTNHTGDEARTIALGMLQSGISLDG